jgi:hypothetical protein
MLTVMVTDPASEIAELMAVKSKHGSSGEYADGWGPGVRTPDLRYIWARADYQLPTLAIGSTTSRSGPAST